jgi:hypothetical protein
VLKSSRPPSPYLSTLPNSALSSRASTAHSRQMGRPQSGSSFMLSTSNTGFAKRPPSVSSQASDEPRRLLDAKVSRKRLVAVHFAVHVKHVDVSLPSPFSPSILTSTARVRPRPVHCQSVAVRATMVVWLLALEDVSMP